MISSLFWSSLLNIANIVVNYFLTALFDPDFDMSGKIIYNFHII